MSDNGVRMDSNKMNETMKNPEAVINNLNEDDVKRILLSSFLEEKFELYPLLRYGSTERNFLLCGL